MGCNEQDLDWDYHWWGISIDWKVTNEKAEEMQEQWESGERGFRLAAIGLAKRKAYYPAAIAESISLLCNIYADDIGDAAEDGCGAEIQFHFTPVTGAIPWYDIETQDQ